VVAFDWHWLEGLGSLGFTVALVPQFVRTLKRKRAKDVDVTFLVIVLVSSVVLLVYSFPTRQYYFAVSFAANLVVWGTVLYSRLYPQKPYLDPNA
jgi:uncharacterized protein with PQ loop repeat